MSSRQFGRIGALMTALVITLGVFVLPGCIVDTNSDRTVMEGVDLNDSPKTVKHPEVILSQMMQELRNIQSKKYAITYHEGGKQLPHDEMRNMIRKILAELPNIRYDKNTLDLITETLIVETNMGAAPYHKAAANWGNYGIAQFCKGTAQGIMKHLKKSRPDVYQVLDRMYDRKRTMVQNLMTNVPFSIALMAEHYWMTDKKFQERIGTRTARARMWKRFYNTEKGLGSVDGYNKAVARYYAKR